jgi:hypothetical protein
MKIVFVASHYGGCARIPFVKSHGLTERGRGTRLHWHNIALQSSVSRIGTPVRGLLLALALNLRFADDLWSMLETHFIFCKPTARRLSPKRNLALS